MGSMRFRKKPKISYLASNELASDQRIASEIDEARLFIAKPCAVPY